MERGEHKGENGKVLIVGGSETYVGCLALAGLAALRTGVDLVYIAAPEKTAWAVNSLSPDLITMKLPGEILTRDALGTIETIMNKVDSMLIGTGTGTEKGTSELLNILASKKTPKVLDADALKVVDPSNVKNAVLTPHAGEFRTMFNLEPTRQNLLSVSRPDRVVLLKGKVDLISDGLNIYENKTGNSGMTVGGTGDVLAGIVSGLLAQGHTLLESAQVGARISGLSGDLAFEKYAYSLLASDIIPEIPRVMKKQVWNTSAK